MHYSVTVIGEDPEHQLSRYGENLEVERHVRETKGRFSSEIEHTNDRRAWYEIGGRLSGMIRLKDGILEGPDDNFNW